MHRTAGNVIARSYGDTAPSMSTGLKEPGFLKQKRDSRCEEKNWRTLVWRLSTLPVSCLSGTGFHL